MGQVDVEHDWPAPQAGVLQSPHTLNSRAAQKLRACRRNAFDPDGSTFTETRNSMKIKMVAAATLVLVSGLVCASGSSGAPQGGSGVVTGVVLGANNKPVPNAVITYQNAGGRAPHVAHADERGRFTISKLKGYVYEIRATGNGFSSTWENVAVHPGKTRTISLHAIHEKEEPKTYTATHTYEQQN